MLETVWPFVIASLLFFASRLRFNFKIETEEKTNPITAGRRQAKTLFAIDKRGSNIDRNSVFDCHLSPVGRHMTIENSVSNDFLSTFVDSIDVFDCRLPGVHMV